jgi:hypothetical protein
VTSQREAAYKASHVYRLNFSSILKVEAMFKFCSVCVCSPLYTCNTHSHYTGDPVSKPWRESNRSKYVQFCFATSSFKSEYSNTNLYHETWKERVACMLCHKIKTRTTRVVSACVPNGYLGRRAVLQPSQPVYTLHSPKCRTKNVRRQYFVLENAACEWEASSVLKSNHCFPFLITPFRVFRKRRALSRAQPKFPSLLRLVW